MLKGGSGLDLGEKPLGADDGGQLGAQHLEGDVAVMTEIFGQIDRGHAALPQLTLQAIAIGQCRDESRIQVQSPAPRREIGDQSYT